MKLNAGYNLLYPTTLYKTEIEVNEEYINDALLERVNQDLTEKVINLFDEYLQETMGHSLSEWKYRLSSWINNYNYEMMPTHTHHGSQLSAIVYLMNEGDGGEITYYDPRGFAGRGYDMKFRPLFDPVVYSPCAGDVVIFPSFIYHGVSPTKGKRISIPFDLFLFNDD